MPTITPTSVSSEELAEDQRIQRQRNRRDYGLEDPRTGDYTSGNFYVPKGDFARFLDYKPPTPAEKAGTVSISGKRAIELALHREMNTVGRRAASGEGSQFINWYVSWDALRHPGRERELVRDGLDAMHSTLNPPAGTNEKAAANLMGNATWMAQLTRMQQETRHDSMRYLEMQYRLDILGKSQTTISNLMKIRHESIARAIRDTHM